MMLTNRSEKIIRILARFPKSQPVTTSIISEELNISTRSVQRELVTVEQWLKSNNFRLIRKRGTGLTLDEPEERIEELLSLLDQQNSTNIVHVEDRASRQRALRNELLLAEDPIKSFYFTDKFAISEGTLSNDLTQITPWFEKYGLKLIRRPGLGIFLQGDELSKRRAITADFGEHFNEYLLSGVLKKHELHQQSKLIHGIDPDISKQVNEILEKSEQELGLRFSDSGFLNLLLYITLSMQHIKKGHTIELEMTEYEDIFITPEYAVAERMTAYLHDVLHINIPREETCGIALQLNATKLLSKNYRDFTKSRDINIHQLILSMIKSVSDDLMIDFTSDNVLLNDLNTHIQPTIGRLRAGIPTENPLLDNLRMDYPDIYTACEHAAYFLIKELDIEEVPASEIGFLTMHFGAAIERKEKQNRRISVVIVCPTGIGTSRLLAADLSKEYPELDIHSSMSAFELNNKRLLQEGIELIISTVKLEIGFRYVQVNPILTNQDKMLLKSKIDIILRQKKKATSPFEPVSNVITERDVTYISTLGREIYQLLDNIKIDHAPILHNRQELISYSASVFADDFLMENHLYEVLRTRDNLADTYIKPFHALLLHGSSPLISHPRFGYVRLELPFYEDGKVILGAIVSFIPHGTLNKISAAITSEAIGSLIEEPRLLEAIRAEKLEDVHKFLEASLLRFYRRTVAEHLNLINDNLFDL